ncbi:uncharacterized protein DNG_08596 [Cephalotrichum gorgonifer]|uniref:PH domain-containing protein n=1 Tax=Cephalotrichum gorgonifer TaxID=2041049 RepID=A0AAE8N6R6_9PEZI|nr:uncharacterized protein DNG_08596 [Cephalotrichum gorgonifer]
MSLPTTPAEQASGTFESLQSHTTHTRRLRPPDLEVVTGGHSRVPLKSDPKLSKRDSRIGLRGIFGRSRAGKDADVPPSPRESLRTPGTRSSWAELSGWAPQRSEPVLPVIPDSGSAETDSLNQARQKKAAPAGKKAAPAPTRAPRAAMASWDPPPLFQAYPQAIRHAHLPACTYSADAVLRMNEKRSAREDLDEVSKMKPGEKKKKHRRNSSASFEWTTKVFVLVTAGYLLQYTGDGSFDRLPEKVLHLGKDSAAFASDAIPGRHWVLHVASLMEDGGATTPESRPLLSRFAFRASEKRHASNFLMVFEGAEDMDAWISVLRKEIEALGGKKNLEETGKPKEEAEQLKLKAQVSQRTLVVRDPDRFSRTINPQDLTWQRRQSFVSQGSGDARSPVTVVESEAAPEPSPDDISTTNSVISHDGRQLDSLRDSTGANNRLSYISSGQRTFITSAGSSPACSPTRDSFVSPIDDLPPREPAPEVRLRPNAAAIADRRQSMLAMGPFVDPMQANPHRPHSTYTPGPIGDGMGAYGPAIPNFSTPHSTSRRYSVVNPLSSEAAAPEGWSQPPAPEQPEQNFHPTRVSSRRCPPSSLMLSRPLSVVADQPSPILELEPPTRPATSYSESPSNADTTITVDITPPPPPPEELVENNPRMRELVAANSDPALEATGIFNPRKASSMQALRSPADITPEVQSIAMPMYMGEARRISFGPAPMPANQKPEPMQRSRSSMGDYERTRSQSPSRNAYKRASLQVGMSTPPEKRHPRLSLPNGAELDSPLSPSTVALMRANQAAQAAQAAISAPSHGSPPQPPSGQFLAVDGQSRALFNRRSMPQLAEGPPPAPPPTCALPPIPQKIRLRI